MIEHLRALAVFAKTVELGSFRAAARALSMAPSVVSHHISQLESRLQLPLLYRSTRRLALTAEGKRLYPQARDMLAAAERGIDTVSDTGQNPRGELRLAIAQQFIALSGLAAAAASLLPLTDHEQRLAIVGTDHSGRLADHAVGGGGDEPRLGYEIIHRRTRRRWGRHAEML